MTVILSRGCRKRKLENEVSYRLNKLLLSTTSHRMHVEQYDFKLDEKNLMTLNYLV